MNSTAYRAALMSLVLVLSSLAGCIAGEEEEDPTILVSTYHVAELVSAVVGDTLDVEIISPSNIPVHDYEPSVADLDRLMNSEIFFYHGLGLEPWVETTLDALGEDAPIAVMTHTMPSGQDTLDYESLLISNLCEVLTDGPFESTTLGTMSDEHDDHDDHDEHSDEEDDHDEHNETDDDHGDHDEHDEDGEEITPETALEYFDTNSDGSLSWDEFWASWEEGEDDDHDDDHDDHNETDDDDHGDHDGEHEEEMSVLMEIFNESDANMDGLLDINELEHFIHEIMELEDGHHEGHAHAEAEETIQNPAGCPTDTVISIFHMEEGEYVLEFESEHDEDFNMAALKMPGGHAHHHHGHDDHGDDGDDHDDHSDDEDDHSDDEDDHSDDEDDHSDDEDDHDDHSDEEMCHNTETHENYESTEEDCEAAGHMWMGDDHDDHHGVCHDTTTHENHDEYETEEECEAAGHMWMEEEDHGLPEIHADFVAHTLSFPEEHDDHDEEHNETDDHSDEEDDHDHEEGHHEVGYLVIHIEEEGDYGFALPTDVEFFVLMNDDHDHGHDDHDDHSDEEDDHSDEEDDHSDEEDDHDDHSNEEIDYDPHSWLSPMAFKAQVDLVLEALSQQYPEHKDTFEENAEAFKAELDSLHMKYSAISDECEQRTVVANHNAYSYIGNTYDIRFVTVHGLDPEGEPSAADIAEVLEQIEEDGLTVLFVEEYTNLDAVAGIVEQTKSGTMPDGISIQTLYTMEMPPMDSEDDYLSLMEKNLDNLKAGMGC